MPSWRPLIAGAVTAQVSGGIPPPPEAARGKSSPGPAATQLTPPIAVSRTRSVQALAIHLNGGAQSEP